MKTKLMYLFAAAVVAVSVTRSARAQTTAFTYQGQLKLNGNAANDKYDFQFRLYNTAASPAGLLGQQGPIPNVNVADGLFTVTLNFGSAVWTPCGPRWLEIDVRPAGGSSWQTLAPRAELTSSPFAINAMTACSVPDGAVTGPNIASGQVVKSLNGLTDGVTLSAGANVTLTPSGNNIQISAAGAGPSIWGLQGTSAYYTGGKVGIGTANPSEPLEVQGTGDVEIGLRSTDLSKSQLWTLQSTHVIGSPHLPFASEGAFQIIDRTAGASRLSILESGRIGLGTIEPSRNLEVQGGGDVEIGLQSTDAGGHLWTLQSTHVPPGPLQFPWAGCFQIIDRTASASRFTILDNGSVGIGTITPASRLHSVAEPGAGNAIQGSCSDTAGSGVFGVHTAHGFGVAGLSSGSGVGVYGDNTDGAGFAGYFNGNLHATGTIGWGPSFLSPDQNGAIELGDSSASSGVPYIDFHRAVGHSQDFNVRLINDIDGQLSLAGNFNVSGNASVCSLTIRGGCDLAEPFQMSDPEIPKGSLVIIDEENAGKLKLAGQAYDTRVAGIVSGANGVNPGISLHQEGVIEGGQNVALSGRVYALADASNGSIKPGDLLTSSVTPGHVMKVTDHTRAQGAIVGKAMSSLQNGRGIVLVLVTLQ